MKDWQRWLFTLLLAGFGGIVQCASDSSQPQAIRDYIRHAAIGIAPAVGALQMTLSGKQQKEKEG